MAQRPRRRTAAKIATKREQGELVAHAKRFAEDPTPLVPQTTGRRPAKIERLERRLRRIAKRNESPRRLRWALRWGPPLGRAYANLLLVGHAGKAERMASMKTVVGDLKYAVRGNVSKRHLVAVQHFRYPEVRILGYREVAQEANGVVWATPEGTAFTPHGAPAPEAWYDLVVPKLPIVFEREGDELRCPHFVGVSDPRDPRAPAGLAVRLGPMKILLCRVCVDDQFHKGTALLARLATFLIGVRPDKDIQIEPTGTPRDCHHEGACAWVRHLPTLAPRTLERYRAGGMTESDLLDRLEPEWVATVRAAGEPLLVAGDRCHGTDEQGFLDAIGAEGEMRDIVRRVVGRGEPVLLAPERSVNKVLEARWDDTLAVLTETHPDRAAFEGLLERHKRSPPAALAQEVLEARRAADAMAGFPRYQELPQPARLADRLALAHRTGGSAGLTEHVDRELKGNTHKGLLWAALQIAGNTQGREWQFSRNDQEAGEFLAKPLQALLEADAAHYHERLADAHTLAGGAGSIPAPAGKHGQ